MKRTMKPDWTTPPIRYEKCRVCEKDVTITGKWVIMPVFNMRVGEFPVPYCDDHKVK